MDELFFIHSHSSDMDVTNST